MGLKSNPASFILPHACKSTSQTLSLPYGFGSIVA